MADSVKEIQASASSVISVLMDFEKYPCWSGLESVEVLATELNQNMARIRAQFSAAGLSDQVTIDIAKTDESTIKWSLVESTHIAEFMAIFHISTVSDTSSKVTYDLVIRFKNPLMNMMKKTLEVQMIDKLLQRLAIRAEHL